MNASQPKGADAGRSQFHRHAEEARRIRRANLRRLRRMRFASA